MNDYARTPDLTIDPVEIAPNTWWIGKRAKGHIFYSNPYLRSFPAKPGAGGYGDVELLIDPGSSKEFSIVRSKIERVIGDVGKASIVFINHQDPDVGSSVGLIMGRHAPKARVLCSEDTWRLVQYYNIPRDRFVPVEKYSSGFRLPNGEHVYPVPSPFCHFVGAVMLYDPQTRVLFSGDLFGSLTEKDATGLWADESDWAGMRAFHQIYMPTNKALRVAIEAIRNLTPEPQMIAPQHGRILRGHWVGEFMRRLERLPVGLDILGDRSADDKDLNAWNAALDRVMEEARGLLGPDIVGQVAKDADLTGLVSQEGNRLKITSMGRTVLERVVRLLTETAPIAVANPIRYEAVTACMELELPTPNIDLEEGSSAPGHVTDVNAFMKVHDKGHHR